MYKGPDNVSLLSNTTIFFYGCIFQMEPMPAFYMIARIAKNPTTGIVITTSTAEDLKRTYRDIEYDGVLTYVRNGETRTKPHTGTLWENEVWFYYTKSANRVFACFACSVILPENRKGRGVNIQDESQAASELKLAYLIRLDKHPTGNLE